MARLTIKEKITKAVEEIKILEKEPNFISPKYPRDFTYISNKLDAIDELYIKMLPSDIEGIHQNLNQELKELRNFNVLKKGARSSDGISLKNTALNTIIGILQYNFNQEGLDDIDWTN